MVFVCGKGCVPNPIDLGVSVEIRSHLFCVGRMALHAQSQRVAAQPTQKGVLRAHDGADVADHLRAALGGELRRGEIGIDEAVVAFVGDVEAIVARVPLIIEVAAVHDDAAEGSRVAVEIFGRGMDDEVRAQLEGTAEHGGGEGVIDGKQHAVLLGDGGDLAEVEHLDGRVSDGLGEDHLRLIVDQLFDLFGGGVGVEKAGLDAHFGQGDGEQIEGAAVDGGRRDDIVACPTHGEGGESGGGHAGSAADRRGAPLQRRNFAFKCGHGGVGKAGIKVAVSLQIEKVCHLLRVCVIIGRALRDGRDALAARLRAIAALHAKGIQFVCHMLSSPCRKIPNYAAHSTVHTPRLCVISPFFRNAMQKRRLFTV